MPYPKLVEQVIMSLSKLPGIGRRSAERIVFWLLNQDKDQVETLAAQIVQLKNGLQFCEECHNLSESRQCLICQDSSRDSSIICVVEAPKDVLAIERTGIYNGKYHVLLGTISPADGRGPEDLKIYQLIDRVQRGHVKEVVIATDPDSEGEMTALYLIGELKAYPVKVSRIGMGLPMGSSVEYVDSSTLSMSLDARREIIR